MVVSTSRVLCWWIVLRLSCCACPFVRFVGDRSCGGVVFLLKLKRKEPLLMSLLALILFFSEPHVWFCRSRGVVVFGVAVWLGSHV